MDWVTWETPIHGPYYVASDPAGSYKTLFYRTDDIDYDRFQNVSKVGYQAGYIFIKSQDKFYWFAVKNDKPADPGDETVKRLINGPLSQADFSRLLIVLKVANVGFQFQQ